MFLLNWLASLLRLLGLSSKKARIVILGMLPGAVPSTGRCTAAQRVPRSRVCARTQACMRACARARRHQHQHPTDGVDYVVPSVWAAKL
jgi:hypothetical protein